MALAKTSQAMRRSSSVEDKLDKIAYNIFGLIPVVSTKQTRLNFRKLSTLCFTGIATQPDVMSIYQMFRQLSGKQASIPSSLGSPLFGEADGSLGVGRSKNSLP